MKAARHEIRNAKKALESLTFTKEEQIYSIDGYQEENDESLNDATGKKDPKKTISGFSCPSPRFPQQSGLILSQITNLWRSNRWN